jgi:drug/metabolite transporter (DMT)-like permease
MNGSSSAIKGHLGAGISILIWGVTFISTKVLLEDFSPIEVLFFRFVFAYLLLLILSPRPIRLGTWKQEGVFVLLGLTGVVLYFLFQNIGLQYTLASNAGVLVSVAPMLTAMVAVLMGRGNSLTRWFVFGFILAISGIALVSFNGSFLLKLNPLGDMLLLLAALSWAFYSNLMAFVDQTKLTMIQTTRKVFFYGLLLMLPILPFADVSFGIARFADPVVLFNMLFLGFGASAFCFLTWNYAVSVLGPVRTSVYIYLIPIVTIAFSVAILKEKLTWISITGTVLILAGLMLSERKNRAVPALSDIKDDSLRPRP